MIDESTDIAVNKDLIMYVKFLNRTDEVQTSFAGVTQLANWEAATIYNAVGQHFEKDANLDLQVSFAKCHQVEHCCEFYFAQS